MSKDLKNWYLTTTKVLYRISPFWLLGIITFSWLKIQWVHLIIGIWEFMLWYYDSYIFQEGFICLKEHYFDSYHNRKELLDIFWLFYSDLKIWRWHGRLSVGQTELSQQSYWRNTYPKEKTMCLVWMKISCCTMHNSTSSIYQGKQHSDSWQVCSGCLEMFIASSLDVKHSDLFLSHDTEKVAPVLVQWFRLL